MQKSSRLLTRFFFTSSQERDMIYDDKIHAIPTQKLFMPIYSVHYTKHLKISSALRRDPTIVIILVKFKSHVEMHVKITKY